jgi:hypothetical protein
MAAPSLRARTGFDPATRTISSSALPGCTARSARTFSRR